MSSSFRHPKIAMLNVLRVTFSLFFAEPQWHIVLLRSFWLLSRDSCHFHTHTSVCVQPGGGAFCSQPHESSRDSLCASLLRDNHDVACFPVSCFFTSHFMILPLPPLSAIARTHLLRCDVHSILSQPAAQRGCFWSSRFFQLGPGLPSPPLAHQRQCPVLRGSGNGSAPHPSNVVPVSDAHKCLCIFPERETHFGLVPTNCSLLCGGLELHSKKSVKGHHLRRG